MAIRDWLRPPRHLVVLFLGIALILVSALAWLGWRMFQQDRALERQRVQVRLEQAADIVAGGLTRRFGTIENDLAAIATLPPDHVPDSASGLVARFSAGAVVLVMSHDGLSAFPSGRLRFYPTAARTPQPDPRVFAAGEALEFRRSDLAGAARAFRALARSSDPLVRSAALLRLARVERKAGRLSAALAAYDALDGLGSTPAGGLPAALVARHASLAVLSDLERPDTLRRRALALLADLRAGRWRLSRAQYEYYRGEACRWAECGADADAEGVLALADGAEWLWNARGTLGESGRELLRPGGHPVLIVWHRSATRVAALVGGSSSLAEDWIGALEPLLRRQSVRLGFTAVTGEHLTAPAATTGQPLVTRTVAETRLPWAVQVASADPAADFAQLAERRRLMLLLLVMLALFAVVGSYAVLRGVSRELEVARLQSDFVSAVSHEFRTPLTSLRQLAELLKSGRVASDQRRAQYYEIMERESGRLHRLVEGLLDFGRMEAGAMEFTWGRVMPSDLVRAVVADFEAERGEGGCRVELTVDGVTPAVRADAEALGRAVWNLLDNAVKYSPNNPTVGVTVSPVDGRVAIAVRDQGTGIPASERAAIFEKFVRGSSADGSSAKGTGIGLAMVRHIVEAHRGEVRVESEVGHGSTFTIFLPVEG
jgi:signal transduction histidine kinase